MSEPLPYQWAFDNSPFPADGRFSTFSVGVYQRLPKASGRGFKKSKTVRVMGYTAEPDKVYQKAAELCRQLNEAGARADDPPDWLQKQYSVPSPPGMVVEHTSSHLSGQQVRTLRLKVMREELLPLGFVKAEGGGYVRRQGEQIHLVDFQASKYGDSFTVNLGFHYSFVPPLSHARRVAMAEFYLLDCSLKERIGFLIPEQRDTWFDYGEDREALSDTLRRCAAQSVRIVDECAHRWADPAAALPVLSPRPDSQWRIPWRSDEPDLVAACISMRLGRPDEAEPLLRRWIDASQVDADKPVFEKLIASCERLRRNPAEPRAVLEDWIIC